MDGEAIAVISQRRGIGAFLAALAALGWSLGFVAWAYLGAAGTECIISATGETCRSTPLARGFGRELLPVMAPAIVCVVVWVLLRRYCTRGRRLALGAASVLTALFAVFCWLAALSVGVLLMPVAGLLGFAVVTTEPPPPP